MKTGIIGQAYSARYPIAACNTSVNMFVSQVQSDGKEQAVLSQWCGEVAYATSPISAQARGMIPCGDGRGYVVIGRKVFLVANGVLTAVKDAAVPTADFEMARTSGLVDMREDGTRILIVDGNSGYTVTLASNTGAEVTDPEFPAGASTIAWSDGYFICPSPLTQRYYISTDATTWEPLEYASAEARPDYIEAVIDLNREVRLFGRHTTEAIVNSGAAAFPFVRPGGAVIQVGIAAPRSACRVNNTCLFLGRAENGAGSIFQITGLSSASRISTDAMEYAISLWPMMSDAFAFSMHMEGHDWYVLTSPSGSETWVYDFSTKSWFRSAELLNGELVRRRAGCYMFHEGKHLVGDYETGDITEMRLDACTISGRSMIRQRAWRAPDEEMRNVVFSSLVIDAQTGVGLDGGVFGEDPMCVLEWSNDGGRTWVGYQEAPLGKIGEYGRRVRFGRLGQARDRVFRVTVTDPVPFAVVGAYLEGGVVGK